MHVARWRKNIGARRSVLLLLLLVRPPAGVRAEQLPTRIYTTADGLAHDRVKRIVQDPRGFLWFCTADGLSRFDGYRFLNFGTADGLPPGTIKDLILSDDGRAYWVATDGGGVCRFSPFARGKHGVAGPRTLNAENQGGSFFEVVRVGDTLPTNSVNVIYED